MMDYVYLFYNRQVLEPIGTNRAQKLIQIPLTQWFLH
jgi:hypothetical protein